MEGRELVLRGKPFTGQKYKEKNGRTTNANWLPTRVTIPSAAHDTTQLNTIITSARTRSKDKATVKNRTRPHSANVPGRKSFTSSRPATGLSAPVEDSSLLGTRDSKHSARIDLRTAQTINPNLFATASKSYLTLSSESTKKHEAKSSEVHKYDGKVSHKDISDTTVSKDNSHHGDEIQTLSAIKIVRN